MERFGITDVGDLNGYPTLRGGDIVVWGLPNKLQYLGINMDCGISIGGECKPTLDMNLRGRSLSMNAGAASKISPWVSTGHARAAPAPTVWGLEAIDDVPLAVQFIPRMPSDMPCFDTYLINPPGTIYSPELADNTIAAFNAMFGKCSAS
jgi:hypothetical protein